MTMIDPTIVRTLRARVYTIREWLADEAPYIAGDRRHFKEHTTERAYWHYGYQSALEDVLELAESSQGPNMGDFHN
jgi:hypothetical protein